MSNARKAVSPGRAMAILSCIRLGMVTLALLAAPVAFADDMELPAQVGLFAAGLVAAWYTWRTYKRARDTEMAMMYDLAGPWGAILTPVAIWIALALTVMKRQQGLRQAERRAA